MKRNCFEYWNLAKSLKLPEIVALWCDIEPSEFNGFYQRTGYMPSCADAKRVILEDALLSGELDYIDEGTPYNGGLWIGNPVSELIEKNRLRIEKEILRQWFLQKINNGQLKDIPKFLDIEKQKLQQEIGVNNKELTANAQTAVAKLLYALLKEHKYELGAKKGTTNDILERLTAKHGVGISRETISKWLDRVNALENKTF